MPSSGPARVRFHLGSGINGNGDKGMVDPMFSKLVRFHLGSGINGNVWGGVGSGIRSGSAFI